jgi:hypothetical protein
VKEVAIVVGALVAAVLAAAVIVFALRPDEELAPDRLATVPKTSTAAVPQLEPLPEVEVVAAEVHQRPVPLDVLETATITAAAYAPGLRLQRTVLEDEWEGRRAEIEDRVTGDVRAYAIGDLLPYGSLLVGISTAAVDVMVGDAHLVRLHADGRIEEVHDLSRVYEGKALPLVRDEPADADEVRLALIDIRSSDPAEVQAAIDRLIAAGHPAIELLIGHVEDILPVESAEYAFPSGSAIEMRPRVSGEIVMMVLEQITGQTFGDLTKEELGDEERRTIARAWRRFLE